MKRIFDILFSSKTTLILLVILAIAMGTGTFIEDIYDTAFAKKLIYNAKWFELLFLLLALNFMGHIKIFNMFRKEKIGGVIFHLAFVIMIIGACITRYFGYEGNMHIREGESSNILYTPEQYLRISVPGKDVNYNKDFLVRSDWFSGKPFHAEISSEEKKKIGIKTKEYIENASEEINEDVAGGSGIIELLVANGNSKEKVFLKEGETKNIGKTSITLNNEEIKTGIIVTEKDGILQISSPHELIKSNAEETDRDTIKQGSTAEFINNYVYNTKDAIFFFSKFYKNATIKYVQSGNNESGVDVLLLTVTINGKEHEAPLLISPGQTANYHDFNFEGETFKFGYGIKTIELPFSIHLNDFILERYAGSESPSSYASEVTVIDDRNNIKNNHRIFMNHILDYDNYRFFQSSFDQDEKGTILSVNHDFWGTWVSYLGYILLTIGFIITLLNKNSRFVMLRKNIVEIRKERKAGILTLILIIGFTSFVFSQNENINVVGATHADKFGHLITQAVDGRFEPVHSLAIDVIHKISRKDKFNFEGKGKMDAMQVFLDMMMDPDYWKQQKIIYIKEQSVRDAIGISTKEASFFDFFDAEAKYKLEQSANNAFRKKPQEQNNFDKEIIKVDERLNILMMVFHGSILKIFPDSKSENNKWISSDDPGAKSPLSGVINVINQDLQLQTLNYSGIMQAYLQNVMESKKSGNYSKADKVLGYISGIQRKSSTTILLPSESKINAEIFYNKSQIFIVLKNCYGILSLLLLLLAFIDNVRTKKSKIVNTLLNISIVLLGAGFLYQTFGMALRAYLLGYAPWSNGYEALILVAWGTLLAGFTFVRYSKITLAATALLAFFILMTASHSSYDPQLTNLAPVLKSYWLIIHVAVLTISYGFLGLGFILGIMNLFLYLFKTKENQERLDLLILELTYINEMNLTIGLFLATVGTFLGGVWANESWGRYWGWDAKETWALIIVITYAIILHLRLIPKMGHDFAINIGSIFGFGAVIMTFVGVNYYLSKGMHSYGAGDTPVFPIWAWIIILSIIALMVFSWFRFKSSKFYKGEE